MNTDRLPRPLLMKYTFAAHLIPGVPPSILTDDEANRLLREPTSGASARDRSFIFVEGPGAAAFVSASRRYSIALCGQYFVPNGAPAAEWIVQAFAERSTECFTNLNGSWRLLLVDHDSGTAIVATDRMGSQRVCFASGPRGSLCVGHDSATVARLLDRAENINPNSLLQYFYFHFVPSPATLFDGIACLPPAELLTWSRSGVTRRRYWVPRFADESEPRPVEPKELLHALTDSVGDACKSSRAATFLSGGLDSSTVLGLATKHRPGAVAPYTIGFDEPKYDETRYARIAADHFGVQLHRYEVTPSDVVDAIAEVAAAYDEPFGNSSAIPTYFCARAAVAAGETALLAGDGGDELFAGNERYRTQQIFSRYFRVPHELRTLLIEPVFLQLFRRTHLYPIRKVRRYVEQAKLPMPDRLQTYNFLNVHGIDRIFTARFIDAVDASSPLRHLRAVYEESTTDDLVDKMLYLDWKLTLADNDLRKVTTMCESAGIAVLFPMLDNRLVDIACRIPGDVKLRHGNLRDFYKKAVSSLLPNEIITKTKHGFGLPFGPWFARSEALRRYVTERLDSLRNRDIVRPDYIDFIRKATIEEHAGYYGEMIWLMCVLESWLEARPRWRRYKL